MPLSSLFPSHLKFCSVIICALYEGRFSSPWSTLETSSWQRSRIPRQTTQGLLAPEEHKALCDFPSTASKSEDFSCLLEMIWSINLLVKEESEYTSSWQPRKRKMHLGQTCILLRSNSFERIKYWRAYIIKSIYFITMLPKGHAGVWENGSCA